MSATDVKVISNKNLKLETRPTATQCGGGGNFVLYCNFFEFTKVHKSIQHRKGNFTSYKLQKGATKSQKI